MSALPEEPRRKAAPCSALVTGGEQQPSKRLPALESGGFHRIVGFLESVSSSQIAHYLDKTRHESSWIRIKACDSVFGEAKSKGRLVRPECVNGFEATDFWKSYAAASSWLM